MNKCCVFFWGGLLFFVFAYTNKTLRHDFVGAIECGADGRYICGCVYIAGIIGKF